MTDEKPDETTLIMEREELLRLVEVTSASTPQRVTAEMTAVTLEELLHVEAA